MILYRFDPHMQKTARQLCRAMFLFLACVCLAGCAEIRSFYSDTSSGMRDVSVFCDNIRYVSQVPLTATVSDALTAVGIRLESSDIVTPGLSQAVPADGVIRVTRISSSDVVTEQVIPFPSRTVRNESLPDGEMIFAMRLAFRISFLKSLKFSGGITASAAISVQPETVPLSITLSMVPVSALNLPSIIMLTDP